MNFIFDIGNVLIDFKPKQFLKNLLHNQNYEEKMLEVIFKSKEWISLDEGTITQEEACLNFCSKSPEHRELINEIMDNLPNMLTPIEKTIKLLPQIKEHGHGLYYLSNYHKKLSSYVQAKYPFFDLFDGGVFSCDVNIVKPNPAIYHHILNKYALNSKDCIFFDDTKENVIAARKIGINSVIFTDVVEVEEYIKPSNYLEVKV